MAERIALITELFRRALSDFAMLAPGDRVLVAVSGGQDSVALLHLLRDLPAADQIELVVAHYNHGLRPEAPAEEQFVRQMAVELGCEAVTGGDDVRAYVEENALNLEAAARELRYRFLAEAAAARGCSRIAVGHTATDVAETLLMNLLRGAGIEGLAAIAPVRDNIIRPLIYLSREQTAEYCQAQGLDFCFDSSNADTENYHRNHIRHHLLPVLERDYGPGVVQALLRAALTVRGELEWTDRCVREALARCRADESGPVDLDVAEAAKLPAGLLVRVLRLACTEAGVDIRSFGWEHWQGMANIIYGEAGSGRVGLPGGMEARRQYDKFSIGAAAEPAAEPMRIAQTVLKIPGETNLPGGLRVIIDVRDEPPPQLPAADAACAVLDAQAAGDELYVRSVRPGDRFTPLGMTGTRKVSDFLIDEKVPAELRSGVPAVVNAADEILWLAGYRISQRAAVRADTQSFYYLRIER